MHRNKTFSIAVEGSGPFVGPLVTDGMRAFRNATWYDRTTATQQDVVVGLGTESGVARAHVCGQRKTRTVRAAGGQGDAKQVQRFIDDVLDAIGQVA
jgi:hypothetical protein